jgi:hypothetical protein
MIQCCMYKSTYSKGVRRSKGRMCECVNVYMNPKSPADLPSPFSEGNLTMILYVGMHWTSHLWSSASCVLRILTFYGVQLDLHFSFIASANSCSKRTLLHVQDQMLCSLPICFILAQAGTLNPVNRHVDGFQPDLELTQRTSRTWAYKIWNDTALECSVLIMTA